MTFKQTAGLIIALLSAAVVGSLIFDYVSPGSGELRIYGSVDLRTVRLAFEESGRIAKQSVEEGSVVRAGDVLAELDAERHRIARDNAQAQLSVAQKELELLLAGSRKEEIAAARAQLTAAEASARLARRTCDREQKLGEATTKLRLDEACSQARVAASERDAAKKNLDLLVAGTRIEQIEVARAQVALAQTVLDEARRALSACTLKAPSDGVIRSRLKEKGDMVGASTAVYELALMNPLRVRAWVDEVNLGRIRMGQKVGVLVDAYPGRTFEGTVGFVSTVAEFTPKTVQTEDLRTALVYEVMVTVADPEGLLRLGMPATVVAGANQ